MLLQPWSPAFSPLFRVSLWDASPSPGGAWRDEGDAFVLDLDLSLPRGADPSSLTAELEGGRLVLRARKHPSARRRTIPIHTRGEAGIVVRDVAAPVAEASWMARLRRWFARRWP